ncbi:MAG: hypothetical protein ACM3H7_08730 [Acidobacteriaceae bacterium]
MKINYGPMEFEIRVRGHLDAHWKAWFEGWTIIELENGDTLIRNAKVDQPGVHSVLNKIRDLNLTLLSAIRKK